jgi:hypothetical protein
MTPLQAAFFKGRRRVCNIFLTERIVHTYLKGIYWCCVDFEKAFNSINRETLSFKLRKIGVNEDMICCIETMHRDIQLCVFVERTRYLDVLRRLCVSVTPDIEVPTLESIY